jgi:hypothetical protein
MRSFGAASAVDALNARGSGAHRARRTAQPEGLTLGRSLLGVDWVLGPSTQSGRYAFDVEVARVLTTEERRDVRGLVTYLRPAATHFSALVEPIPAPTPMAVGARGQRDRARNHAAGMRATG